VDIVGYETSRIIYLMNLFRNKGSAYLPEVAEKIIREYCFLKFPNADEIQKENLNFALGKFQEVQIGELNIYADGIIVSGRCETKPLEDFVKDLFVKIEQGFGFTLSKIVEPEMHFESSILVQSARDITSVITPHKRAVSLLEKSLSQHTKAEYRPSGIHFETDAKSAPTRRKPARFTFERRMGVPLAHNIFYSQAPMRTEDHFSLLEQLEALAD
jgi:hypothetical protein